MPHKWDSKPWFGSTESNRVRSASGRCGPKPPQKCVAACGEIHGKECSMSTETKSIPKLPPTSPGAFFPPNLGRSDPSARCWCLASGPSDLACAIRQGIWTFKTAGNLATTGVTGRTFPLHHDIFALVRLRTPASLINIKTLGGEYCSSLIVDYIIPPHFSARLSSSTLSA